MHDKLIDLDFGSFLLEAELFDTAVANRFADRLPYDVSLMQWGNELYGSIGIDLGEENPVPEIPAGGLAYTNQGDYVCIFFGQRPAWAVEYIGRVVGDQWKNLIEGPNQTTVVIRRKGE